jgi:ATP-binding cassette, subfamily B, bacterial
VDGVITPRFGGVHVGAGVVAARLAVLAGIGVARAVGVVLRRANAGRWNNAVRARLARSVLDCFQAQPLAWHRRQTTGELLAKAESDCEAAAAILSPLPYSIAVVILLVIAPVFLLLTNVVIGLVAIGVMPVIALLNAAYQRRIESPARNVQDRIGDLSSMAHEAVDGVTLVKAMGAEAVQQERFEEVAHALREAKITQVRLRCAGVDQRWVARARCMAGPAGRVDHGAGRRNSQSLHSACVATSNDRIRVGRNAAFVGRNGSHRRAPRSAC